MGEWLKKYVEMFDDGFPMNPLGWGRSDDEIIEIIKECIEKKKDAYELGLVNLEEIY